MIYKKTKPVEPNAALLRARTHTKPRTRARAQAHTHTHALATAVLPLGEEPLKVQFVMVVGPFVALC